MLCGFTCPGIWVQRRAGHFFLTEKGQYAIIKTQIMPFEEVPEMLFLRERNIPGPAARNLLG